MNTIKRNILLLSFGLMSSLAFASGNKAEKALQTTEDIKTSIVENLSNMDVQAMKVGDATVEISFSIDSAGKLVFTKVNSDSFLAEAYVKKVLRDTKLIAAQHLSNKSYKLNVRYVQL